MFSTTEKSNHFSTIQRKNSEPAFFRKAGEETFFGSNEQSSFFNPVVQTKLSVSSPDDPQEKEADAMADQVMRMADPAPVVNKEEEKLQKKDEEKEEVVQTKGSDAAVQMKCAECEKEEKVQGKIFRMIQRSEDATSLPGTSTEAETISAHTIDRKEISIHHSDVIQRSGRGPPGNSIPFEQSLSSSKGGGSSLPSDTKQFMESRFHADFSGVRVHTGSYAEGMSRQINAHAFTHGNDVYFNSGRYSPNTESGATLLAHELTHTIQQGASKSNAHSTGSQSSVSRKNIIHRSADSVPSQLTNAVAKAKALEGKIDANKPQADGYRTGWEKLLEIFKTTFGEDMIISGGGGTQGTVAEQDIKKKREQEGVMIVDKTTVTDRNAIPKTTTGSRDAMPSWCGIFVFWALNKSGVPMPKWKLGERMIKPEAARLPGEMPMAGDIAYRNAFSHFAIVESVSGGTVKTVNGNTAGEDNLGGQVQIIEHPLSDWTAFFNPLLIMEGSLGSGEGNDTTTVRSLKELRKKLFNVQRKPVNDVANEEKDQQIQTKTNEIAPTQATVSSAQAVKTPAPINSSLEKIDLKENINDQEKDQAGSAMPGQFDIHRSYENIKYQFAETGATTSQHSTQVESQSNINAAENNITGTKNNIHRQSTGIAVRGPPRGPPLIQAMNNRKIIQRSWLGDAWDAVSGFVSEAAQWVERGLDAAKEWLLRKVRDFVSNIPGYRMLCLILGEDPITGEPRPLTGENLLNAGLDLLPGVGYMFRQLLNRLGIFNDVAAWLQGRIGDLSSLASGIANRFIQFWNRLSLTDVGDPEGVMNRVADLLRSTINDIVGFVTRSAVTFLEMIKRVMIREIAAFVRNRTPRLFPLLTVALGFNPETMEPVQRNGTNILNALLEVSEEGREQRKQMMETGTFQRIAGWIDRGIAVFSTAYHQLIQAFRNIWNYVTIENLFHPIDTFTRIWNDFSAPVRLVGQFLIDAAIEILKVIKNALLGRLSAYARQTRGFTLICVIIGRDPFTGVVVPRTVHNLVKGFMSLMDGGEQQYEQLKESGAIDRIVNKVMAAVARLNMTPQAIIQLFFDLWNNVFSLETLKHPIQAFQRIVATFAQPILRLIRFVIEIIMIVVEAILILMNFPFALIQNIIAKARQAFEMIKRDPVGFLKNLLRAIKQGFIQFFDNILQHLLSGLVGWLTSELRDAGVPAFTDTSLRGIISWVLQVLGISMEKIWEKLAAHPRIGPQRVARIRSMINTLEGIWTFIKDVQERGMAAIWDKIQEQLSNLWNTILDAVKNWIMEQIINKMVAKLLSMLDPTGIMAVVNSAIALYSAIQSFIKYLREMLEIVNSFVEGLVDIASGNIATAANYLERTLARAVPIVIGFLANQVGLSGIGKRIGELIGRAREMVDQALTWLVNKAVDTGMALLDRVMGQGTAAPPIPNNPEAHRQLANQAKAELENSPVTAQSPNEALQQKQQAARNIERTYSGRLQSPLRMTITLVEQSHTDATEHVATRIVIAPNDTVVEDTMVINLGSGQTTLRIGTPLRRKEANDWTHGLISAIGEHDRAGRSVTIQFGRDAQGGTTSIIPITTLQRDLSMDPNSLPRGGYALDVSDTLHGLYKPQNIVNLNPGSGGIRMTYKTHANAEFTVTINPSNETHTVEGRNLQLKDWANVEGRGVTQTPAGFISGLNLNRAHLIADRFLGSGYTSGLNLITTSAEYNQIDMAGAENRLDATIIPFQPDSFDLTVSARLSNLSTSAVQSGITASVPAEKQAEVSADIAAFASAHSNFKVCMGVTYNGLMKKGRNQTQNLSAGPLGPDRYLKIP